MIDPGLPAHPSSAGAAARLAEVIKHAIIQPSTPVAKPSDLEEFLIRNQRQILGFSNPALTYALRRNVALKSRVVEADERESGVRAYLNFGHTVGHAIEASDYRHMHGEAIAIGMHAASHLSVLDGRVTEERLASIVDLLQSVWSADYRRVRARSRCSSMISSDKKRLAAKRAGSCSNPTAGCPFPGKYLTKRSGPQLRLSGS